MTRNGPLGRRALIAGAAATALAKPFATACAGPARKALRFGLTPVFLTNDLDLLGALQGYLSQATGHDVELVQRRTYQEITALLVSEQLDAAWICGFPFVAYREQLSLVAVPLWRNAPLYQSYLISPADRAATGLPDLEGDLHAFSDPDSNSGYLVTRAALAALGRRPAEFFKRTIFTWGHRNVVRAVAAGLASSGSVDGYVWDVLADVEPGLVRQTRVVQRSELLGFPPIACPIGRGGDPGIGRLQRALLQMGSAEDGRAVLRQLRLDGFVEGEISLFNGIASKLEQVRKLG